MLADDYDIAAMMSGSRVYPDGSYAPPGPTEEAWIAANRDAERCVVQIATLPENLPRQHRELLASHGISPLQGLSSAMVALDRAVRWGEYRDSRRERAATEAGLPPVPVPGTSTRLWSEAESKHALGAFGLPTCDSTVAPPSEAASSAATIGFPVVVKAASPVIAHKAKAGAVAVGLTDQRAVRTAVSAMSQRLAGAGTPLESVLVERMVSASVCELILGIAFDARFGHALVFGRGGVEVESLRDTSLLLLPAHAEDIQALIRDHPCVGDLAADVVGKIVASARAVVDFATEERERLVSLDINPSRRDGRWRGRGRRCAGGDVVVSDRRAQKVSHADAVGLVGPPFEFDVERGKVHEFARTLFSFHPEYLRQARPPMFPDAAGGRRLSVGLHAGGPAGHRPRQGRHRRFDVARCRAGIRVSGGPAQGRRPPPRADPGRRHLGEARTAIGNLDVLPDPFRLRRRARRDGGDPLLDVSRPGPGAGCRRAAGAAARCGAGHHETG